MQSEPASNSPSHALVFSGFKDRSPETMRRVKTALVADLQLDLEIAKRIVERFPSVIMTASNQQQLDPALQVLVAAGALVEIIDDPSALQAMGAPSQATRSAKQPARTQLLSEEEQLEELLFSLDQACLLPSSAAILEEIRPTHRSGNVAGLAGLSAALNQPLPFDVWSHVLLTAVAVICAGLIGYYF